MFLFRTAAVVLALLAPGTVAGRLTAQVKPATQAKPAATAAAKPASSTTTSSKPAGTPLDLNTATIDQLKVLPGIGDVYAKRIIDGRPYTMKNQIVQKGIVTQAAYDKIKDGIIAKRTPAVKR